MSTNSLRGCVPPAVIVDKSTEAGQRLEAQLDDSFPEKFHSIKDAAALLGLRYWHLQRAVKRGLVPSHRLLTTKRFVRLSEIIAALESSDMGGRS